MGDKMEKIEKVKRGGFLRGMLDGWRSSVGSQGGSPSHSTGSGSFSGSRGDNSVDIDERLRPTNFDLLQIAKHGFPHQPTAVAFDPVQRLLAVGNRTGSLRILGRPGVDVHVQHVPRSAVIQLIFIRNEGTLLSVCADDSIHLWNIKQKQPGIVQSLKFQRERITYCHLPFQSKWLYIGTERGNIHVANIESFTLSGYVINWNKAIELSRKTHPGAVIHLSDCPCDANKLLIGFDSGTMVLWDLRMRAPDTRISYSVGLKSVSWHHEGRQFLCSHSDGSLTTWNVKTPRPVSVVYPHSGAKEGELKGEPCKPMWKVEWRTVRNGDSYIIFSGALPYKSASAAATPAATASSAGDAGGGATTPAKPAKQSTSTQSLTIIQGKTTTVLEMEHNIVDFITLNDNPYDSDFNDPYAVVVLLQNDLVVVDLTTAGYPCFQNPYTMDLHESPITCCFYLADCASDLIPAFYSVGFKTNAKRSGFSEKEWPVNGGEWGSASLSYAELLITGHADGTLKFYDASSVNLHILYKMKTSKLFEKPKLRANATSDELDDPFAIDQITLCSESRLLCVAGASSQVILYRFSKQEASTEVPVVEVVMKYDAPCADEMTAEAETMQGISGLLKSQGSNDDLGAAFYPLTIKSGQHKRLPGYHPDLVCLSPWLDHKTPPYKITSLCIHAGYNLVAYGNENGLVIIDLIQRCIVFNVGAGELYGSADPYQRFVKSPKKTRETTTDGNMSDPDRPITKVSDVAAAFSPTTDSDKANSFSRSRSSSIASIETTLEAVQCLVFADTFTSKSDNSISLTLWVGTSLGGVISVTLTLPETNDDRVLCLQSVLALASGNIFRLNKGSIKCIAFLDNAGTLMTVPETSKQLSKRTVAESHFVVLVSEKQARVLSLPSQSCPFKATLTQTSFVVRADVMPIKSVDGVCLITYLGTGNILAYSLPSLKPLFDVDFLPLVDVRIARTLNFSNNGHGLYMPSPAEFSKFTVCCDLRDTISEMQCTLFQEKEMPEPPKQSFFKGLFTGGGPSLLDREELFGEQVSGKGSKTMARTIPGPSAFDATRAQAGSLASELAKVKQGFVERGENLELLDDRTAQMADNASGFRDVSSQLLNKYKDRKWYQF